MALYQNYLAFGFTLLLAFEEIRDVFEIKLTECVYKMFLYITQDS